jgi:hypothetical protein
MNNHMPQENLPHRYCAVIGDEIGQIEAVIAFVVQKIMPERADRLVFIDYGNNVSLLKDICVRLQDLWRDELYCPQEVRVVDLKSKSLSELQTVLPDYAERDVVIFFGFSNILSSRPRRDISMVRSGLSLQIGPVSGLNWGEFREKVLSIRSFSESNMFFHVIIERDCQDVLGSTFDNDAIDIYVLSGDEGEIITTQKVVNDIRTLPYDEARVGIESLKAKFDLNSYLSARIMLCMHHYRYDEALSLLDGNYSALNSDLKKLLADFYSMARGGTDRALAILTEIHDNFPNTRGLYESISRIVLENDPENGQRWMEICLARDPENIVIMESAANFYNKKKCYEDAEKLRRKLFDETGNPKQLLLAEVLSICKDGNVNGHDAEKRVEAFVGQYRSDPEINNESYYRLGLLWFQRFKSDYKAFQALLKVSTSLGYEFSGRAAKLKLVTLSRLAGEGKTYSIRPGKYTDVQTFFGDMLISSIPALTLEQAGFGIWRNFIEEVQDQATWGISLAKMLITILDDEAVLSIRQLAEKSYYLSDPQIKNDKSSIFNVRLLRSNPPAEFWDQSQESIDQLIDSPEGLIAYSQSPIEECFVRYQLAIMATDKGKTQFAQNQALSLWLIANQATETSLSKKARMLGLVVWGYSRLRSGDSTEGLACLLASVRIAIECGEVGPLIEDVYRSLLLWTASCSTYTSAQKERLIKQLKNSWQPEHRERVYLLLNQQRWGELYDYLQGYIRMDRFDSEWAIDFLNFVQAAFFSEHRQEAGKLIVDYHENFYKAFQGRINARPNALHFMAQAVLFGSKLTEKHLELAKLLLDRAIADLEVHRNQFFHREERAFWQDKNRAIYQDNAVISVAFANMCRPAPPESLLNIMNRVTVRSLVENRESFERPSPELIRLRREYEELLECYATASTAGGPRKEIGEQDLARFEEIRGRILREHPFFRSLPVIGNLREEQLRDKISEDEILCQVVIGKMWSASMIATKDGIWFDMARIGREEVQRHVETISKYVLSIPAYNTHPPEHVVSAVNILSEKLFGPLNKVIGKKKIRRVFLCKDVALGMFSSGLIRVGGRWLFECVDSIQNLVCPIELMQRADTPSGCRYDGKLFLFGPGTDKVIKKIYDWQRRPDISQFVTLEKIDINQPDDESRRLEAMSPYIAVIAGHGMHDTNETGGAAFIKGKREKLSARDLSPILKTCEYIVVLSCRSGTPDANQPESSEGVWAGMVGTGAKGAVLCSWDVDAEATLEIIEYLLKNGMHRLSSALCEVKRGMIENSRYCNPYFWGGVEYWGSL